jgi:hypothetical protein
VTDRITSLCRGDIVTTMADDYDPCRRRFSVSQKLIFVGIILYNLVFGLTRAATNDVQQMADSAVSKCHFLSVHTLTLISPNIPEIFGNPFI